MTRVIGYIRVSTGEQADSGAGLQAQRERIEVECARRGWELVRVFEDAGLSGKSTDRPGFEAALEYLQDCAAEGIVVSNLDRLTRSLKDFAELMEKARAGQWNLVALDLGVDLSTPAGEFLAHVMASVAQWERRIISQRTKSALAVKKAQGVKLGGPTKTTKETRELIRRRREAGESLAVIAAALNEQGIETGRGGKRWYPSSVQSAANAPD